MNANMNPTLSNHPENHDELNLAATGMINGKLSAANQFESENPENEGTKNESPMGTSPLNPEESIPFTPESSAIVPDIIESENNIPESKVPDAPAAVNSHEIISEETREEAETSEEDKELTEMDDELPNFSALEKIQLIHHVLLAVKEKPLEEAGRILRAISPILDALLQDEYNNALNKFIEEGGEKDDFEYHDKENAKEIFNKASKELKQKRVEEKSRQEEERSDNLRKKEAILDQIKHLTEGRKFKKT